MLIKFIYYFIWENDFQKNYFYFFICEIISIFMDFFCCIYNEYITLFCCGLEYDTRFAISKRAVEVEIDTKNFYINEDEDENSIMEDN